MLKQIKSRCDLAINGASPAFIEPLHVGRPNIGNRHRFLQHINEILDRRWLTNNGPVVQEFERRIAKHLDVRHCIAICNGTVALEIAIRALGLHGEVIVPSWTFVATAHALYWQGITPVFADIDPVTHNLDPDTVRSMITPRTTGIIGVHLWGRAAPVDELQTIADEHDLKLMFDAAHAFGSAYKGQTIGRFGACEVLSFHATKVFNTMEGGAIVTNDDELAETIRVTRNFGFSGYDSVISPGTNGKLPEINAAMGLVNLDVLPQFVEANRRNYHVYAKALTGIKGIRLIEYDLEATPNYQYIVIEIDPDFPATRDEIITTLQAENVLARKYFWPGCHRMKPYRDLQPHAGAQLSNTEAVAERVVILPTGVCISDLDIEVITRIISLAASTNDLLNRS
jgi:dTDP-4-amino-4,6-dideoxygalactose transaminase